MSDRPVSSFDEFSKLPGPLIPAAAKIMKLSNAYVVFNDTQKVTGFNWGGFKGAVVAHPGTDLAFDKLQSTSITNQTPSVDDMASKIAQFLVDTFAVKANADGLRQQITSAFNSLDKNESSGWFSSYNNEGHGSSWEYRIVFALPNPDHADWFYSVVSTIKCVRFPDFRSSEISSLPQQADVLVQLPRNADETYCTHRNASALRIVRGDR